MPIADRQFSSTRLVGSVVALVTVAATLIAVTTLGADPLQCPPGTIPVTAEAPALAPPDQQDQLPGLYRGPGEVEWPGDCRPAALESFADLAARDRALGARATAPFQTEPQGARLAGAMQRQAMVEQGVTVRGSDGTASLWGQGPLNFDEAPYDSGQGIVDSTGRIDDFFHDVENARLFAAIGTGGVWLSEGGPNEIGTQWRSIGDGLPTNVTSAVSWTPSGGPDGTVVVLTGEHTFGGASYTGLGAYFSDDVGVAWQRAEGPPDGTLGFAIEVDPTNPDVVYAATGRGLWRSADAGRTYSDVELPVGACQGDYNIETCNYAHFVTDVIVKAPGGVGADTEGGAVMAAVGYRAGMLEDVSGEFVHSEGNGIYVSATGEPQSFERLPGLDGVVGGAERLGRIEFGPAVGAEQDHDIVYAVVEDAVLFNGGAQFDPLGIPNPLGANSTYLNGIYVSADFGQSWTLLADDREMADLCTLNQSVFCIPGLITPGIQSWYNMWIAPDPSRQQDGVPTRLVMGLEEVWQNRLTQVPANTPAVSFQVIGAYYGGADCLLVVTDCMVTGPLGLTTTHPDQHDGIFIPTVGEDGDPDGGVRLLVGHDGGLSSQVSTGSTSEFSQDTWTLEQENGLATLLPYSVAAANDGTAQAGLQDNGTMRIIPEADNRQFEILGADGTIGAIDPEDSDYSWAGSQGHGQLNVSSDGFLTSTSAIPPGGGYLFIPPLQMDPLNSDHVVTGGNLIEENINGRDATTSNWSSLFDLGTSEREPIFETDDPPPDRQASAVETRGDAIYAGFCGPCDILNSAYPFDSGLVTNVGAAELPEPGTPTGFHFATAEGLPERYITSIAIDPYDETAQTVYVTLGGYTRDWVPPGTGADEAEALGTGHVYVSRDAGETFSDISGTLPDIPALWVEPRHNQLLVGTDVGPFLSSDTSGGPWAPLGGDGFPSVPVTGIQLQADDPDVAYLSVYGRGVMRYDFPDFAPGTVERLFGERREVTSVTISQELYESATTVVLARSDAYADALAGATLAAARQAPLLLTQRDGLDPAVAQEIQRLGASTAILLGGEAALTAEVEGQLADVGVTDIQRLAGDNRFATAAAVAGELGQVDQAWIVQGNDADPSRGWPDAMSVAPVAAAAGQPILLTETDRLPQETVDALSASGATTARVVGGTAAVSQAVEDQVGESVELGERVAGPTRFATNVAAVAAGLDEGLGLGNLWLARADNFADALAAGPSVAASGGSLLLVDRASLADSGPTAGLLERTICQVLSVRVAGGQAAISDEVLGEVEALLGGCDGTIPAPPEQALVTVDQPDGEPTGPSGDTTLAGPFAFEGDAEGWTVSVTGDNPATSWSIGDGGHESDQSFQVIPYQDLAETSLTSPEFESAGDEVFLSWFNTFDTEGDGFDEVAVEWSDDGGESWTPLTILGGQNLGYPEFSRNEVSFTPTDGPFQVRYRLYSDLICSSTAAPGVCARPDGYEGVRIDTVELRQ